MSRRRSVRQPPIEPSRLHVDVPTQRFCGWALGDSVPSLTTRLGGSAALTDGGVRSYSESGFYLVEDDWERLEAVVVLLAPDPQFEHMEPFAGSWLTEQGRRLVTLHTSPSQLCDLFGQPDSTVREPDGETVYGYGTLNSRWHFAWDAAGLLASVELCRPDQH